eukprot:1804031-Rhodomonas_salina.1
MGCPDVVPGLRASPFWSREMAGMEFVAELEANCGVIKEELLVSGACFCLLPAARCSHAAHTLLTRAAGRRSADRMASRCELTGERRRECSRSGSRRGARSWRRRTWGRGPPPAPLPSPLSPLPHTFTTSAPSSSPPFLLASVVSTAEPSQVSASDCEVGVRGWDEGMRWGVCVGEEGWVGMRARERVREGVRVSERERGAGLRRIAPSVPRQSPSSTGPLSFSRFC